MIINSRPTHDETFNSIMFYNADMRKLQIVRTDVSNHK